MACRSIAATQPKPPAPKPRVEVKKAKNQQVRVSYTLPDDEKLPADLIALKQDVITWLSEQRDIRGRLRQLAYDGQEHGKELYRLSAKVVRIETMLQDAMPVWIITPAWVNILPGYRAGDPKEDRLVHLQRQQTTKTTYAGMAILIKSDSSAGIVRRKNELAELKNPIE